MARQRFEYEVFGVGPRGDLLSGPPDMTELRKEMDDMASEGWRLVSMWSSGQSWIMCAWEREYTAASETEKESRRKRLGFMPPDRG